MRVALARALFCRPELLLLVRFMVEEHCAQVNLVSCAGRTDESSGFPRCHLVGGIFADVANDVARSEVCRRCTMLR